MRARKVAFVAALVAAGIAIAIALLPDLWRETEALLRAIDNGRSSPFERNAVVVGTAIGAFAAYKRGVGPVTRRRARSAWVVAGGAWVYFTWVDGASWTPEPEPTASSLCFAAFAVLTVGLLFTRIRRHLRGTWKPTRDFFVVDDRPPPWR